ncbi:MAG: zinc-binding dehydrogenase [Leptolyngbya sp. SIO4C1]|nr:zinc-binding dehydrogenase [Leptolyngbya sp. SIO4C1]
MKAVVMTAAGDASVLTESAIALPELQQESDLLIRLKVAGVNPVDTKIRQRGPFVEAAGPTVLGCDGAGIVEAAGSGVRRFSVGDAVYFCSGGLGGPTGNYAEYVVVDERYVAAKPAPLSFVEAAAAPLVLITAWEALADRARLIAGQRLLIHGGAGGVGHVAIQLAKLVGASVCTTVSSEAKANFVSQLGADHCIYYPRIDFVAAVLNWTSGAGVDTALDLVGEPVLSRTFEAVKVYGDVVSVLSPTAETDWQVARSRNLRFGYELMLTPQLQHLEDARRYQTKILEQCARRIEAGQLKIHVDQVFPLAAAAEAHRQVEQISGLGKVVLEIE